MDMDQRVEEEEEEEDLLLLFSQSTSERADAANTDRTERSFALATQKEREREEREKASQMHATLGREEGGSCNTSFHEFRATAARASIVRASGILRLGRARVLRVERARRRRRLSSRLGSIARGEATPEAAVGKGE